MLCPGLELLRTGEVHPLPLVQGPAAETPGPQEAHSAAQCSQPSAGWLPVLPSGGCLFAPGKFLHREVGGGRTEGQGPLGAGKPGVLTRAVAVQERYGVGCKGSFKKQNTGS